MSQKTNKTTANSGSNDKPRRIGRPSSSSDVRLTPHFRSPVDIERLGKALVAIALKQTVKVEDGKGKGEADALEE